MVLTFPATTGDDVPQYHMFTKVGVVVTELEL